MGEKNDDWGFRARLHWCFSLICSRAQEAHISLSPSHCALVHFSEWSQGAQSGFISRANQLEEIIQGSMNVIHVLTQLTISD